MKKNVLATILMAAIFAVITIFTPSAEVSANNFSMEEETSIWLINSFAEEGYKYYEFNDDNIVNVIDLLYAKWFCLNGQLNSTDLISINSYLLTGNVPQMDFAEYDVDHMKVSPENDELFANIISGRIVDVVLDMDNLSYRVRFLKDNTITELRSSAFSDERPYLESENNSFELVKMNKETKYAFPISILQDETTQHYNLNDFNASYMIPDFDNLLSISETQCGLLFYTTDCEHTQINEYTLENDCNPENIKCFETIINYNGEQYVIAITTDNKYAIYNDHIEVKDLSNLTVSDTDIEQLVNYLNTGELFQTDNPDDGIIFLKDNDSFTEIILPRIDETVTRLMTFEYIPEEIRLILGLTDEGNLAWDINSPLFQTEKQTSDDLFYLEGNI